MKIAALLLALIALPALAVTKFPNQFQTAFQTTPNTPNANSIAAATYTATNNPMCQSLTPFYWEAGNATGTIASGTAGLAGSFTAVGNITGGTTLTINSVSAGYVSTGLVISGTGITAGTTITQNVSGAQAGSTWTISPTQGATGNVTITGLSQGAFVATGSTISGTTLTIGTVTSGAVTATNTPTITGTNVKNNTSIVSNISGSGNGSTWKVSPGSQSVTSTTITGQSTTFSPVTTATQQIAIASASKWIYAIYLWQLRGGTMTAADTLAMQFSDGYNNMGADGTQCSPATTWQTINECLTQGAYATQTTAYIGRFYYDAGHYENHASQQTSLGNVNYTILGTTIQGVIGVGATINYNNPLLAGGIGTTARQYITVLRGLLNGSTAGPGGIPLKMNAGLGVNAVCTNYGSRYQSNPNGFCTSAVPSQSPIPENWHYAGSWIEDDDGPVCAGVGDGAFSSPGSFGTYPSVDATKSYYIYISRLATPGSNGVTQQGYASAQCGRLIRRAYATGNNQTGSCPI